MKKRIPFFRWFLLISLILNSEARLEAQEEQQQGISWGLEFSPYLSYSGYNTRLGVLLRKGRHEAYAGPKLAVSNSDLPEWGLWGGQLGYRYHLVQENRWEAFVNLDYQLAWYEPYNPLSLVSDGKNQIHEVHLAFGVSYGLGTHWRVGSQIGTGFYLEKTEDLVAEVTRSYSGYSNLMSLFVQYMW